MNAPIKLADFKRWYIMSDLSYSDVPGNEADGFVYVLRHNKSKEILYVGSADDLYRRFFVEYIGGIEGDDIGRIHDELMFNDRIRSVEVAWNKYPDYESAGKRLLGDYLSRTGKLPVWNTIG